MSVAVCKTNTGVLQGHPEDGGTIHLHTHTHWAKAQELTVLGVKPSFGLKKEIIGPRFIIWYVSFIKLK